MRLKSSWCWRVQVSLGFLGLALLSGCGGGPRRVQVTGDVTIDGTPLNGGVVNFAPDASKGNNHRINCVGPAQAGKYKLHTQAVRGSESGEGVPLGWYKVYLYTDVPGVNIKIHDRFTNANSTPLSIEVVDNPAPGAYDIKFSVK